MEKPMGQPPQHPERQPGLQSKIHPQPEYKASGKLEGKVAIITGGDSGIGERRPSPSPARCRNRLPRRASA